MRLRRVIPVLLLLAFTTSVVAAQSKPKSSASKREVERQQSGPISQTYGDTVRMLRAWIETEENDELAHLFAMGDTRASDLATACRSTDDELASVAFLTLQLLGNPGCESCADSLSQKHGPLALSCGANLTDTDFERMERWWATRHTTKGYQCGDDYEPLTPLDDSLVYALILDGSARAVGMLNHMLVFERAYASGETILKDTLSQTQSLIVVAKDIAHNLKLEPGMLEDSIRASAFFLPPEYRKTSKVEVVARNGAGDRILVEVSYVCGRLCGRGYYVVLRKDGPVWQYAAIRMAWIS